MPNSRVQSDPHTIKSKPPDFRKILDRISTRHDTRRVFDAFTRLCACALAAQTREPEYLEEVKRWEKPEMYSFVEAFAALVMEMNSRPFEDILGVYYTEFVISPRGQQRSGEFHTPKPICDLMARITLGNADPLPPEGSIKICEPACGAGAMILSLAEACSPEMRCRLRVTAIDINRTACDMAFINTTLWGVPTRVIHGNALSTEYWAAWSNIHYVMPWLPLALKSSSSEAEMQGRPPEPAEVEQIKVSLGQQELTFG